jgi:hypothetical protein
VPGDVADAHAAGVEPQHPVIQAGETGLALLDQLRLKRAVAVPRRLDLDRPELGVHTLRRRAVAVIARPAGRRLAGRKTQMLGQLGAQRRLEHPASEPRDQPTRAGDLLRRQTGQRVLQRLRRQQPREPVDDLLTGTLGHRGTRRPPS